MKAASTDDRFQDNKEGGPILTEGALSSRHLTGRMGPGGPSSREDRAGGAHLPSKMGPGGPDRRGASKFYDNGRTKARTALGTRLVIGASLSEPHTAVRHVQAVNIIAWIMETIHSEAPMALPWLPRDISPVCTKLRPPPDPPAFGSSTQAS